VLRTWPEVDLHICSTGQHREMLEQVLTAFGLRVDQDLKVMTQNQTLNGLARDLLDKLDRACEQTRPDIVLVHGDTTTSFIASWPPSTGTSPSATSRPACAPATCSNPGPKPTGA
jgi:UDP-N-acetylglucosamine 2-epimerase (non-hydrolysing)